MCLQRLHEYCVSCLYRTRFARSEWKTSRTFSTVQTSWNALKVLPVSQMLIRRFKCVCMGSNCTPNWHTSNWHWSNIRTLHSQQSHMLPHRSTHPMFSVFTASTLHPTTSSDNIYAFFCFGCLDALQFTLKLPVTAFLCFSSIQKRSICLLNALTRRKQN